MLLTTAVVASLLAQAAPQAPAAADAATAAREAAEAAQKAAEAAQKAAQAAAALAGAAPAAPAPAAPAAPPAPPPVVWSGTVTLGLIALTGNSQTITFATNAAFERKSPEWVWGIKGYAAYGQNNAPGTNEGSQVTALNAGIQARGDRRFSDALALYLMAGADTDHLKSIESRPFGEIGISLLWWDVKEGDLQKSTLKTDLGFRYGREYRFQYYPVHIGPSDPSGDFKEVDLVAPRLGVSFRYALNKDVIFTEDVSALGNVVGDARLLFTSTSKLSSRLTEKVALGVSFVVNDDTLPPVGKVPTDTALTIGLDIGI